MRLYILARLTLTIVLVSLLPTAASAAPGQDTAPSDGWTFCAAEFGYCAFTGTRQVRYGAEGHYVYLTRTDGTACSNEVFGDPIAGALKQCHTAAPSETWTFCAAEYGYCAFTGTQRVRYGADGRYFYATRTNGTACGNDVFGDPIPGALKQCHTSAPSESWTFCASEFGYCAFTGTRQVRYGADGRYVYATRTNGTPCGNDVFGDPSPGTLKECHTGATTEPAPIASCTVSLLPGADLQQAVASYTAGTVYCLQTGVHRITRGLVLRDNDTLTGDPGARLSGAIVLGDWTFDGRLWYASGQRWEGLVHGTCRSASPRCAFPEELFRDDATRLVHAASLQQVTAGRWYFDRAADRVYVGDDPRGHLLELSVAPAAVTGVGARVTIRGITIEKIASPAQSGAIHAQGGRDWTIDAVHVRQAHGVGVRVGPGTRLERSRVIGSGQLGVGGTGAGILIDGNEIAVSNAAGYETGWEAGALKFTQTLDLIVRGNNVHHNDGPGIWTDGNNLRTLVEGNTVDDNASMGILHEISYDAVFRGNTVRRNGRGFDPWLWGGCIVIAASPNVEVSGNQCIDNSDGIAGVQQARGSGTYGPHLLTNLYVHDNEVRLLPRIGATGVVEDINDPSVFSPERRNRFERNRYVADCNAWQWEWRGPQTWASWQAAGQDVGGSCASQ
jgi:parallel beta-helix repeat protein